MKASTLAHRNAALAAIDCLFSDTTASEQDQIEAMQDIIERCTENVNALIEQINDAARG